MALTLLWTTPEGADHFRAAVWNGAIFCALGETAFAYISSDGETWTAHPMLPGGWNAVEWNGALFCAVGVGGVIATSPDGVTWTARTSPSAVDWTHVAWNGATFCASHAQGSSVRDTALSADGLTWSAGAFPSTDGGLTYVAGLAAKPGLFVATVYGQTALASADGITWTVYPTAFPLSDRWLHSVWNGAVFCCVDYIAALVATSVDGAVWTTHALPVAASWSPPIVVGTAFVVIGDGTVHISEDDGATWVSSSLPPETELSPFVALAANDTTVIGSSSALAGYHLLGEVYVPPPPYDGPFWTGFINCEVVE